VPRSADKFQTRLKFTLLNALLHTRVIDVCPLSLLPPNNRLVSKPWPSDWQVPFRERMMGRCTAGKLQRILASSAFSQHAKLNMAVFVLYLPVCFGLRYRMVEFCPNHLAGQPSAFSQKRTFHRKGRPATPSSQNRASRGPRSRKGR
jgi:hypothetical protein